MLRLAVAAFAAVALTVSAPILGTAGEAQASGTHDAKGKHVHAPKPAKKKKG